VCFGEDVVGCLGPDERGAAVVPAVDEVLDGGDQFFDAGEGAASDGLAGDDAEEDFDHVHPRSRRGGEVHGDPRILGEPVLDLGVFVGGVVVGDHVQADPGVGLGHQLEEVQELGVGVPVIAGVGHCAGGDLQRREQARSAVAGVVVGGLLWQPSPHRQDRSGAVERLDLGFLVDADHDRLFRRVQVQADDVADPRVQLGVGGESGGVPARCGRPRRKKSPGVCEPSRVSCTLLRWEGASHAKQVRPGDPGQSSPSGA